MEKKEFDSKVLQCCDRANGSTFPSSDTECCFDLTNGISISLYFLQAFSVVVGGAVGACVVGACAGLLVVVWWWLGFIITACYIKLFGVRRAVKDSACFTKLYSFSTTGTVVRSLCDFWRLHEGFAELHGRPCGRIYSWVCMRLWFC